MASAAPSAGRDGDGEQSLRSTSDPNSSHLGPTLGAAGIVPRVDGGEHARLLLLGQVAQARRQVHAVADDGVLVALRRPDEPGDDRAGSHPDAGGEYLVGAAQVAPQRLGGTQRVAGVVVI